MGAKSRAKGGRYEYDLKVLFKERGWHCVRHYQRVANNDTPDLTAHWETSKGIQVLRVEAKNRATMPAKCDSDALDQALASSGPGVAVACIKRPGKGTEESVVLLRLADFLRLVEG